MSGDLNILSMSLLSFFFCATWPPLGRRLTAGWDATEDEKPLLLFERLLLFADLLDSDGPEDLADLADLPPLLSLLFLDVLLLSLPSSLRPISSGETDLYIVTILHLSKQRETTRKKDLILRYLEDT